MSAPLRQSTGRANLGQFVNQATGGPVGSILKYAVQLLRPGEATLAQAGGLLDLHGCHGGVAAIPRWVGQRF